MFLLRSLTVLSTLAVVGDVVGQTASSSDALLSRGIQSLGGRENLEAVRDVAYVGGGIFRSKTMAQTFSLTGLDQTVAGAGRQNVSFSFEQGILRQRIDRFHEIGPFFIYGRPNLEPFDFSLVVQGGNDGFAAVVGGSYSLFAPAAQPQGYRDGLLAAFLVNEAIKSSPLLLLTIAQNNNHTLRQERTNAGVQLQAVHDETLGISVVFDPDTDLPYLIRSYENHNFFGPSTHDLLLHDYTTVNGVRFPRRFKTIYNREHPLTDYSVAEVLVNTGIPSSRFEGPPGRQSIHAPARNVLYDFAEIGEYNAVYSWNGQYTGTFSNVTATQPWADLPGVWLLIVTNAPAVRQLVLEIGENVIVLDAPPHQSLLVIQWVREVLGKSVTHVWASTSIQALSTKGIRRLMFEKPTHHHHDHAYGTLDYVAAGARVIALEDAVSYYSAIPRDRFVTYTTNRPLTLRDGAIQASFVHMEGSLHSTDYGYTHVAPRCVSNNSTTLVFDADDANTANVAISDHSTLTAALNKFAADRVALNATFVPAHGDRAPLTRIINGIGYRYPSTTPRDFRYLQSSCPRS